MADKKEVVVKSNRLIEASYRLTLIEQQLVLFAICKAREEDRGFSTDSYITVRADEFAEHFGTNGTKVYEQLKEAKATLQRRTIKSIDEDPTLHRERVTDVPWLYLSSYVDGAGQVQITFHPLIVPYLTRLEAEFTSYRLAKVGTLSSAYAIRLYELLVQFLKLGEREFEIAWLKEKLDVADDYPRVFDLCKRVLDVGVRQINAQTDLDVSYQKRKTGREITHFVFKIASKSGSKLPKPKRKHVGFDEAYLTKHARPGETRAQAIRRLQAELFPEK